jgi:mannose-6-phosphate isomerase
VLVPAGTPHAIGPGVFLAELQEPTDLSILLEWRGFLDDATEAGSLGLGYQQVLAAVDRTGWSQQRLAGMCRRPADATADRGISRLLPPAADPFFRAELLQPAADLDVPAGYAVWIVARGEGALVTEQGGTLPLRRGMTVLVPYADGVARLSGDIQVIRCLPPGPPRG